MTTDGEALEAALRAKAELPVLCPVCGHGIWGFPNERVSILSLDAPADEPLGEAGDEHEPTQGFWPITCLKCGFVRLFHVETLLET